MFDDYCISFGIIVGASMCYHIKGPFFDSIFRAIQTKSHIVSSSRLMDFESFNEVFLIHTFCYSEDFVLSRRFYWLRISKIYSMTI